MTTRGGWARPLLSLAALVAVVAAAMVLLHPSVPERDSRPAPGPGPTVLSPAERYAYAALGIMGDHSLFVDEVTWWPGVVREAMAQVHPARSPADTYGALTAALAAAAGPQGRLVAPRDVPTPEVAALPVVSASAGIGRITVPSVGPLISDGESARAGTIADLIGTSRPAVTCGWVVDLRDTRSQEDWGLLAGLTGFLRDGEAYQLRDRLGTAYHVSIVRGSALLDGRVMAAGGRRGATVTQPVAVLQSGETAGVGEALALALRQSDRTRTFGADTRGLPFTKSFTLSDGAQLVLPTTRLADRAGHELTHGIQPQVRTHDPEGTALGWLQSQCKRR